MLFTAIGTLPLENYFPTVAGMTVSFLIFALFAVYIIVNRPRASSGMWCHPIFVAAYAFMVVSALLEFSSPLSRYDDIFRFAQMIGGAVCVSVICRDRSALVAGLYGYIAAALLTSVVLFSIGYGSLQGMQADDFEEADHLRVETFSYKPLGGNINHLAFLCAQGAVVAFALSLSDRWKHLRVPLLGVGAFCVIASFLPMSRGVVVIVLVCFVTILYVQGFRYEKALVLVGIVAVVVYIVVPDAIWSRMVFSTETKGGKMESRASVYTTALNRLPECFVAGVGAGNYFGKWGLEKGFARGHRTGNLHAVGLHNSLLAITIYWGVLGLSMFLWIIWAVYRSVPSRCGRDELSLALLGILVANGVYLLQIHGFYDKMFTFGIGMLVGARQWIWPTGVVSEVVATKHLSEPKLTVTQAATRG